jgi:hypothetical protein
MKIQTKTLFFLIHHILSSVGCAEEDITVGPPPYDKPWVPAWGWFGNDSKTGWKERYDTLLNLTRDNLREEQVVFLGASLIEAFAMFEKDLWKTNYEPLKAFDYGIGGDSTRQVIWRIDHGEFDGLSLKVIVLNVGNNNLGEDFNRGTDSEIAQGVKVVIEKLKAKFPTTKILLVALLPRRGYCTRIKKINELIAKLDGAIS